MVLQVTKHPNNVQLLVEPTRLVFGRNVEQINVERRKYIYDS